MLRGSRVMTRLALVAMLAAGTACSNLNTQEERVLSGGAIGAGVGAAVGAVTGVSILGGAAIGAAAGAVGGYIYDRTR